MGLFLASDVGRDLLVSLKPEKPVWLSAYLSVYCKGSILVISAGRWWASDN
jgi:hypothetical protein